MKPINLNNIEEKNVGGGDFPQLKPRRALPAR